MSEERSVKIINAKGALQSFKHERVSFEHGICELIDNSIDAGSRNLLLAFSIKDEQLTLAILDDGIGIPELDGNNQPANNIQLVLRYGGKLAHKGHPFPIGKFGFGLSQTATCLSTRTTVYSKVNGGSWRSCFIDQKDLEEHRAFLPPELKNNAPTIDAYLAALDDATKFENLQQGTLVVMEGITESGYSRTGSLQNFLERELGRIYRHQLSSGVSMHLVNLDSGEPATKVIIRDPLCQMTDSYEVNRYGGTMPVKGNVRLVFDGVDVKSYPAIKDPVTGGYAVVEILMVNYDVRRVYNALGVQANATVGGKEVESRKGRTNLGRAGFNRIQQGFSLVRNGRELRSGQSLGIFTKDAQLNYFKGQISFPTCLDRLFGVQYVKNRFGIDPRLVDVLRDRCQETIYGIRGATRTDTSRERARSHASVTPTAEERSGNLRGLFKRPAPPAKEHEQLKAELEKAKQARIEKVKQEEQLAVMKAKQALEAAKLVDKPSGIKAAKENLKAAEERKKERVKSIRNRFQNDFFMRKFVEPIPGGDLYALRDWHDEIWVIINQDSEFFKSLYANTTAHAERQALLDLMIFAIAHAEAARANSDGMKRFWKETRGKITRFSQLFVTLFKDYDFEASDPEVEEEMNAAYESAPEQVSLYDWGVE